MIMFKIGDKVFFPALTSSILILSGSSSKRLYIDYKDQEYIFDEKGYLMGFPFYNQPSIFHATYTEYERLSNFYPNANFTKPPKTNTELVNIMLENKVKYFVLKWFGFGFTELQVFDTTDIKSLLGPKKPNIQHIDDCILLDQYTGKKIIDWNEGKPVLQKS